MCIRDRSKITLLFLSLNTPKKLAVEGSPANRPSYEGGDAKQKGKN